MYKVIDDEFLCKYILQLYELIEVFIVVINIFAKYIMFYRSYDTLIKVGSID
ncbi:hypothetical protein O185_08105 [Photorhabdus temperata J3]|uniref:Uncharacterized protein n=1 Tax=Photorhabdus temperata J3 TaxID=1389415 RepID=U7R1Y9_PHOTE|nr:hypothetical protein O185_08105 [Photorhabdus temperata J3]